MRKKTEGAVRLKNAPPGNKAARDWIECSGGENMLLAFVLCLGFAAIVLLAVALCRISAHAEKMERRCWEEKDQTS